MHRGGRCPVQRLDGRGRLLAGCQRHTQAPLQGHGHLHGAGDERAAREGLGPGQLLLQRGEKRAEDRRGGEVKKVKAIPDPAFGHEH